MSRKSGFTLVELVVVVLILGILAAVAVPKIITNSDDAADSGVSQTLASIRDALELYKTQANSGGYPQAATSGAFHTKLQTSLRGSVFPKAKVGGLNSNAVKMNATLTVGGTEGWVYDSVTGEIIVNSSSLMRDGVTAYSDL